jgi:hypothetical protein
MNDKRAGGTGAVIDKINAKLKIPASELSNQAYHGIKLHKIARLRSGLHSSGQSQVLLLANGEINLDRVYL